MTCFTWGYNNKRFFYKSGDKIEREKAKRDALDYFHHVTEFMDPFTNLNS